MTPSEVFIYAGIAAVVILFGIGLVATRRSRRRVRRAQDPYVEALASLVDGDKATAFLKLQESVRSGLAPTDAYIRLGKMLRENGDAAKALQLHKSLTVKSDLTREEKTELFVNIAKDYSTLGKPDQAVNVLETAVKKMNLKSRRVLKLLAREYHLMGDTEAAFGYLKELKKTDSIGDREISLYLFSAGEQKLDGGDDREARKLFQRALKYDQRNPSALYALGNLDERSGDEEEAIARWKKVALASPELSARALKSLERVMFQRGTFSEIERVYREVLEARPWDEYATLSLASFYKKQGRGAEAIEFLEEFKSMHPESVGATLLLTSLYATLRDAETLEKFLDENESYYTSVRNHACSACGFQSVLMRWHCPRCNRFDSFIESHEN